MIPQSSITGHLPVGRFNATLVEVAASFVQASQFESSVTRAAVWDGFLAYLAAWSAVETQLQRDLLKAVWIGGSFISQELNPSDIDVSPVYDHEALKDCEGKPGIGGLKRLIGHRISVVAEFRVEPFPIPWHGVASTLFPERLTASEQTYLAYRGGMDDWWQRARPHGARRAPESPTSMGDRGYLEVTL